MTGLPALCPHCGQSFQFHGFGISEGMELIVSDIGATCPRCGETATVGSGAYTVRDGFLVILGRPDFTPAAARKLKSIVEDAQLGQLTKEQAISRAREVNSVFAALLQGNWQFLAFIVSLLTLYLQYQSNVGSDESVQKLTDAIRSLQPNASIAAPQLPSQPQQKPSVENQGAAPPKPKAAPKVGVTKSLKHRHSHVDRPRKKALKARRSPMGNSRSR